MLALDNDQLIVRDANGQQLAYVYFEDEPGRRSADKLLTRDETRPHCAESQVNGTSRVHKQAEGRITNGPYSNLRARRHERRTGARVYDAAASWAGRIMPITACRNCSRLAKTCAPLCHPDRCRRENNRS